MDIPIDMSKNVKFPTSKPKALMCHICGREYGTTSLPIHIPQCEKIFLERESLKPAHERRPLPKPLAELSIYTKHMKTSDIETYNDAAYQQYKEKSMIRCEHCGRRFADDRIAIHHRSCTAEKPARRIEEVAPRTALGVVQPHRLDALAKQRMHLSVQEPENHTYTSSSSSFNLTPNKPVSPRPNTMQPNGRKKSGASIVTSHNTSQTPQNTQTVPYNYHQNTHHQQVPSSPAYTNTNTRPKTQLSLNAPAVSPNHFGLRSPVHSSNHATSTSIPPKTSSNLQQNSQAPPPAHQPINTHLHMNGNTSSGDSKSAKHHTHPPIHQSGHLSLHEKIDHLQHQITQLLHQSSHRDVVDKSDAMCWTCNELLCENAKYCHHCGTSIFASD